MIQKLREKKMLTTTVKRNSMRGTVLSYILSEPGSETVNTIVDDLYHGTGTKKRIFNACLLYTSDATENLFQRGLIYYGEGKNKTNKKLHAFDGAEQCLL